MDRPKISVIMSVYNGEKYLREAIESILNQTFRDFEFIIINDGSTDKTSEILSSYNDPRIVIINNKRNIGLTKSLNKGLKMVKGEYIARQDADDVSLPERLERMVNFLDMNRDVGLLGSSFVIIDEKGNKLKSCKFATENKEIKKRLLSGNHFGSEIFRKTSLEKVGFYREEFKYAQDYDLALRISEKYKVGNLSFPFYKCRINFQSISVAKNFEQNKYAEFAKELAGERRKYGKDRLQTSSKEEIDKILSEMLSKNKYKDKRILADGYFHGADLFYVTGDYLEAKKWLVKSLQTNFFNIKSWILFLKIMICLKLSPKIIKGLKSAREQFYRLIKM